MYELRPYQTEAIEAINEHWQDWQRELLVLPTGMGKTVVFNEIARQKAPGVLILCHRDELIQQSRQKFGGDTGKIKADENSILPVTVGSVQTMCRRTYDPDLFSTIIVDEAHHAVSPSYQAILRQFPDAKVLGVTATADRADKKNLGQYFDGIAYQYSLKRAVEEGWLCNISARTVPIDIDFSNVKVSVGDFEVNSIAETLEPYLPEIAKAIAEYAADRKTVVFLPLVSIAKEFRNILESVGLDAREINGQSNDRKEILEWFDKAGPGSVLCNAMLLCLDSETEILTSRGFLRHDEITEDDEVANWNFDGSVFFEKPKQIVHRYLEPTEHMVSVESRRINFRVTNTHRMIVGCGEKKAKWKKISAQDLTNRDVLPGYGIAEPKDICVEQKPREVSRTAINNCAYRLAKTGMDRQAARAEAIRRANQNAELRYKNPSELTLDECRFIGFWIADGTRTELAKGGIEYSVAQSHRYMNICNWFDGIIEKCGYDSLKKIVPPGYKTSWSSYRWSFPRGTGSGPQKRNGLYPIEPYLCKDGSSLFWGLNEKQFDALVEGYWYGDGYHGTAENGFTSRVHASDTNKKFLDLLCAIGSVRGWNCSMQVIEQNNPKHRTQYGITMIKEQKNYLSNKTEINHEPYKPEMVWCVRTTSKNIITRRHGKVTVMGNTEGWDCPSVDCVVVLRPTKVRALYTQMIGRGTRLSPGKKDLLILDFLWLCQKHNLCKPAHLVTDQVEDQQTVAKRSETEKIDLFDALTDAEEQRKNRLAEELRKQKKKKSKLINPLELFSLLDDIGLADYEPSFKWEEADASQKQIDALEKFGIDAEGITKGYACRIMDTVIGRSKKGLATMKQVRLLNRFGYDAAKMSMDEATKKISRLAAVNWQRWRLRD